MKTSPAPPGPAAAEMHEVPVAADVLEPDQGHVGGMLGGHRVLR